MGGSKRTDWLLLVALVLLTAVGALVIRALAPPEHLGGIRQEPSTFYNAAYGSKAAYLTLERLGYDVARLRRPIAERTLRDVDALFVLSPTQGLTRAERDDLLAWVDEGGTLVLVPPRQGLSGDSHDPDDDWLRWTADPTTQPGRRRHEDAKTKVCFRKPAEPEHVLASNVGVLCVMTESRLDEEHLVRGPLADDAYTVVWRDDRGAVLADVAHGDGRIIVSCDAYPFSNTGLSDGDHISLLLNVLSQARQDGAARPRLAFDEYHLGFPERAGRFASVLRLVLAGPWGMAAAQSLIVLTLALYARGVRFGAARDIVYKRRRSHGEFITGAARLLAAARAWDVVWRTLYPYYRQRLCKLVRLPPSCRDDELAQSVERHGGLNIEKSLAAGAHAGGAAAVDKTDLLRDCDELERAIERLEHGSTTRV